MRRRFQFLELDSSNQTPTSRHHSHLPMHMGSASAVSAASPSSALAASKKKSAPSKFKERERLRLVSVFSFVSFCVFVSFYLLIWFLYLFCVCVSISVGLVLVSLLLCLYVSLYLSLPLSLTSLLSLAFPVQSLTFLFRSSSTRCGERCESCQRNLSRDQLRTTAEEDSACHYAEQLCRTRVSRVRGRKETNSFLFFYPCAFDLLPSLSFLILLFMFCSLGGRNVESAYEEHCCGSARESTRARLLSCKREKEKERP